MKLKGRIRIKKEQEKGGNVNENIMPDAPLKPMETSAHRNHPR